MQTEPRQAVGLLYIKPTGPEGQDARNYTSTNQNHPCVHEGPLRILAHTHTDM